MTRIAFKRWHMVMQDLLDKHLDGDISRTLRFETNVTHAQKAAAWERLQARAQQQTQLAPFSSSEQVEAPRGRWVEVITALRDSSAKLLHTLILDEAALERARAPRRHYPYPYYDIQARWVQPVIIAMSA